jgi:hypothetical protein
MKEVFIKSYYDGAYGIVYQIDDGSYSVYEVPQYGGFVGEEQHAGDFASDEFEAAKALASSFI